jgi:uncharacterized protein YjbI with pentapeptide repeats
LRAGSESKRFELSERQHVTERFTRAVDQLGGASQDVRLGGLYALEQIYTDSERERSKIIEVIAAFAHSHLPPQSPLPDIPEGRRPAPLPVDIQAALTIFGRLRAGSATLDSVDLQFRDHPVDLTGIDCSLGGRYFAVLIGARLVGAVLIGAHLNDANLTSAYLTSAYLTSAYLDRANLTSTNLTSAYLTSADLRDADLNGARLVNTRLTDADLTNADLNGAHLNGADLTNADLGNAHLEDADLDGATVTEAHFRGATGVDLTKTIGTPAEYPYP